MTALPVASSFGDRIAAGRALAAALARHAGDHNVVVLGMPRGGVVVARVVADALRVPLDVVIARKLGVPGLSEVALGAIAEGMGEVVPDKVGWFIGVSGAVVERIADFERVELERRVTAFRGSRPIATLVGRTVIIVDDGFATGATLRAAAASVRRHGPREIIAAIPVGSPAHRDELRECVDELVLLEAPEPFDTVSAHYDSFPQVTDADVRALLGLDPTSAESGTVGRHPDGEERLLHIPISQTDSLAADLGEPHDDGVRGLVILAHGGGSSRNSYRNRYVAGRLRMEGWATLRVDLLLEREQEEDTQGDVRFDVARISRRLRAAVEWAVCKHIPGSDRIVLLGASTGAAAAAVVAADLPDVVSAIIARAGRVDLAGEALRRVHCPVLMIVGSNDRETLKLNRRAVPVVPGSVDLKLIRGAGHTFEEPGTLGSAGEAMVRWLSPRREGFRGLLELLGLSGARRREGTVRQ